MADLDEDKRAHLTQILSQSPCLQIAHELKEEFRAIYEKDETVKSGQIQIKNWLQIARIFFPDAAPLN